MSTSRWLTWTPKSGSIIQESPEREPPKPPKHTFEGFEGAVSGEMQIISDAEPRRSSFVAWLDQHYKLHLKKSSGTGFDNLCRHYREWEERKGQSCSDEICRAMLKELCFEVRTVRGVEMVQGLVPRDDLEACQ